MKFLLILRVRPDAGDGESERLREAAQQLCRDLAAQGIAIESMERSGEEGVGFELYGAIDRGDSPLRDDPAAVHRQVVAYHSREDHRPWGYYLVLADEADHKVKRIVVYPGKRLSLQLHRRRSEHWHVLWGEAVVSLDGREIRLGPGESVDIDKGASHRIRNPGETELAFIEVQRGDYFGEDDIERLEDDFGRI